MSNHNELIYSVSNHNTFELFNSILNEENEENNKEYCLISNEPLNNSKVTLPCGHSFNYLPLLHDLINYKKIHHNRILYCPYCRINIYGNIPYRYDISKIHCKDINYPTNKCYLNNQCCYKDCSRNATIPHLDNTYICYRHYKVYINKKNRQENKVVANQKTHNICKAILKTGKRKGEYCNAKLKNNCDTYCKRHNKINQFEEQESIKKLNNLENKSVSN
jgi:hypothetical protein